MIRDLVLTTRTVRRFREELPVSLELLEDLVDLARFGGSARNSQPLRYMIVSDNERRDSIFPHLAWAGYLRDWAGPAPGERPVAYIICLLVRERCTGPEDEACFDLGISTQNMLLAASEKGISGCRIGSFSSRLAAELGIDEEHKILLVLALGYPAEKVVIDDVGEDGDIRYWRDSAGIHHVPKRSRADITYPRLTSATSGKD